MKPSDTLLYRNRPMAADYSRERLAAAGDPARLDAILQAELRERAASKLPLTLSCSEFRFPTALSAEQATGDHLAALHAALVEPESTVLDMTCGLGIDAFHIARRALSVTAIDIDSRCAEAVNMNARALGLDNVEGVCADSTEWLRLTDRKFDVIFIDPARRGRDGRRLFALADCSPNVVELLPLLRQRAARVIIKASPMLDISRMRAELGVDADIIVYGESNECKELTAVIPGAGLTRVIDGERPEFSFLPENETSAEIRFAEPEEGQWLHEPSSAMLKSGAFRLMSERFGLSALAPDTHLYVGNSPAESFPGEIRPIVKAVEWSKRAGRYIGCDAADIAVRNFVMSAEELRMRLGIKRGGDGNVRIIGVRSRLRKLLLLLGAPRRTAEVL